MISIVYNDVKYLENYWVVVSILTSQVIKVLHASVQWAPWITLVMSILQGKVRMALSHLLPLCVRTDFPFQGRATFSFLFSCPVPALSRHPNTEWERMGPINFGFEEIVLIGYSVLYKLILAPFYYGSGYLILAVFPSGWIIF